MNSIFRSKKNTLIHLFKKITDYLEKRPELWVRDAYACADHRYRMNIRVINEKPWNNLFAYNMFLRPTEEELENFNPNGIFFLHRDYT